MAHGTSGHSAVDETDTDFRTEYYLHNTAAGKAILTDTDPDRVEGILGSVGDATRVRGDDSESHTAS